MENKDGILEKSVLLVEVSLLVLIGGVGGGCGCRRVVFFIPRIDTIIGIILHISPEFA